MARIVIVDDDEIIAEIVSDVLTRAGHEVRLVDNGNDAIGVVQSYRPDLLILDYTLPGRSGRDILRELRALSTGADLRIMMLTGRHGRVHSGIAEIDGADDYVTKPFEPGDLLGRIEALLAGSPNPRHIAQASAVDDQQP